MNNMYQGLLARIEPVSDLTRVISIGLKRKKQPESPVSIFIL